MTPTERLRALVRDRMMRTCPNCGHVDRLSLRDAGAEIGTSASTLSRFLNDDAPIDSDTFDRLSAWIERPRP